MPAGKFQIFNEFMHRQLRADADYLATTVKAALLDASYTPNLTAHTIWGDVSAHEVNAGTYPDYVQKTVSGKVIDKDGSNRPRFVHGEVDWGSAVTISAKYYVEYVDGATKYLAFLLDLNTSGGNLVVTNGPLKVAADAAGLWRATPNPA